MFFFDKLFSTSTQGLSCKEIQVKKNHLQVLERYYRDKVDYLSNSKIPPSLAAIVCRDVPRKQLRGTKKVGPGHIKSCLRYYKIRLSEVGRDLKKIL